MKKKNKEKINIYLHNRKIQITQKQKTNTTLIKTFLHLRVLKIHYNIKIIIKTKINVTRNVQIDPIIFLLAYTNNSFKIFTLFSDRILKGLV